MDFKTFEEVLKLGLYTLTFAFCTSLGKHLAKAILEHLKNSKKGLKMLIFGAFVCLVLGFFWGFAEHICEKLSAVDERLEAIEELIKEHK